MADSQSRFSIIDELIEKKTQAQNEILAAQRQVSDKEFEIKRWEKNVLNTRDVLGEDLTKLKEDTEKKVATLQSRISELDKGITAIQTISSTSTQ